MSGDKSTREEFYSDIAVLYPVCPSLKIFLLCLVCQEFFTQMREEIKIQFLVCTSSLLKNQSESAQMPVWTNKAFVEQPIRGNKIFSCTLHKITFRSHTETYWTKEVGIQN